MESLKSELSLSEVLGEQGNVLPERALMRHHRRGKFINLGAVASADHGSAANSNSNIQLGNGNTNTTTQTTTVINIL